MITSLLYIVFVFSALVLIVVILLQEGKGGGFGQALGEQGPVSYTHLTLPTILRV